MKRTPLKRKTPLRAKTRLRANPKRGGYSGSAPQRTPKPPTSPAADVNPPKARKPLRARSKKRERQDRERDKAKAIVWERAKGRCELASPIAQVDPEARVCSGPPEYHEPKKRSRGGDPTDPDEMVLTCHAHHRWTEDHPALADEIGATRPSWAPKPTERRESE